MKKCPNINSKEFKDLVEQFGENEAYARYNLQDETEYLIGTFDDFVNLSDEAGIIEGIPLYTQFESINNIVNKMVDVALLDSRINSEVSIRGYIESVRENRMQRLALINEATELLESEELSAEDVEYIESKRVEDSRVANILRVLLDDAAVEDSSNDSGYRINPNSIIIKQAIDKVKMLKTFSIVDEEGNVTDIDEVGETDASLDRNSTFKDDFYLTLDNKKTTSTRLRLQLASLNKKTIEDSRIVDKKDFLGDPIKINFNAAYEELHRILNGQFPEFSQMIKTLENYSKNDTKDRSKLWIQGLINKLENDYTLSEQSEFVSDMTTHYVNMSILSINRIFDEKLGYYTYKFSTMNANQSSLATGTLSKWVKNLKESNLLKYDSEKDDYVWTISKADYNRISNKYYELKEGGKDETKLKDYLMEFGIDLESEAASEIVNARSMYLTNGTKTSYNGLVAGPLKFLHEELEKIYEKTSIDKTNVYFDENSLITQSAIGYSTKSLALVNAKYTPDLFTNSYRVGKKSIYAYTKNNYASNRARDLKNNDRLISDLKETTYSKFSLWLKKLEEASKLSDNFDINYVSLNPINKKTSSDASLGSLTESEHEIAKLGAFYEHDPHTAKEESEGFTRKSTYFGPTLSDKSTALSIKATALELTYTNLGNIQDDKLDLLIDYGVASEWDRIYQTRNLGIEGNDLFYFFPEMNDLQDPSLNATFNSLALASPLITDDIKKAIRSVIRKRISIETKNKLSFWKNNNISTKIQRDGKTVEDFRYLPMNHVKDTHRRISEQIGNSAALGLGVEYFMAQEMVYNYMMTNMNMFQLVTGDQALFYKSADKGDYKATDKEHYLSTLDNIGKRLAAEIAPGYSLSNHVYNKKFGSTEYIQIYANSIEESSNEDFLKMLTKLDIDEHSYDEIDTTDAQEYTTWKEHLTTMLASGRISDKNYDKIYKKLSSGNKTLNKQELAIVMTPMKPVYTNSKFYSVRGLNLMKRTYIKSASFPLLPQLTNGLLELDSIREKMEEIESSEELPVRFAYSSAVKVGMPKFKGSLKNEDSSLNELVAQSWDKQQDIKDDVNLVYEKLEREGLRIQQDVPYDVNKDTINVGSQQAKLNFTDLLEVDGFNLEWAKDATTGSKLKKIYDGLVAEQFHIKYKEFLDEFTDSDGYTDVNAVSEILLKELNRLNPTIPEIKGLDVENGEFVTPLWLSPHSKRYSSIVNSILFKRLVSRKARGGSAVLGSPTLFKVYDESVDSTGITFSNNFDLEKGLLPMRQDKDGNILPAQILVPFTVMKEYSGTKLNLSDFTEEYVDPKTGIISTRLDFNKIPEEVLRGVGFRIPTQSRSSMSYVEIVGFLPDNQGDLIIAPKEFVEQMGSDFDLDKLFRYMHNTELKNGVLEKIVEASNIKYGSDKYSAVIENKLLDINIAILSNNNKVVQKSIFKPLDFGKLPKYKADIKKLKETDSLLPTYLSSEYNRDKYMSGVSGKDGTAFFASATVLNSVLQGHSITMSNVAYGEKGRYTTPIHHKFGNAYGKVSGNLSKIKSSKLNNPSNKSDIFAGLLSSAVDNEKERLLDELNINKITFPIVAYMVQLGYEEDIIIPFINQDIILEYVKKLKNISSISTPYVENIKEVIQEELFESYSKTYNAKLSDFDGKNAESIMLNMMNKDNRKALQFNDYQSALLHKFIIISKEADGYNSLLQLGNVDSKGLGKSLTEAQLKISKIGAVLENKTAYDFENIESMSESSISLMAFDNYLYGTEVFNDLFINTSQQESFDDLVEDYKYVTGKTNESIKEFDYSLLVDSIKYYVSGLDSRRRHELLVGDNSVLNRLNKIRNTDTFKYNKFFNKLDISKAELNGDYGGVIFNMNSVNDFQNTEVYQALVGLLNDNKVIEGVSLRQLAEDLITYSMLDGARFSPISFSKYIPSIYYERMGLNNYGKGIHLKSHVPYIVEQIVQHNPGLVPRVATWELTELAGIVPTPKYVTTLSDGKTRLYKHVTYDGRSKFVNIDILGDGNVLNEFSYPQLRPAESVLDSNKSYNPDDSVVSYSGTMSNEHGLGNIQRSDAEEQLWGSEKIFPPMLLEEEMDLASVLNKIDDPIAKVMVSAFKNQLKGASIKLDPLLRARGVAKGKDVRIGKNFYDNGLTADIEETIIHESVHILTSYVLLNDYMLNDEQRAVVQEIFQKRIDIVKSLSSSELASFMEVLKDINAKTIARSDVNEAISKMSIIGADLAGISDDLDNLFAMFSNQTEENTVSPNKDSTQSIKDSDSYYDYYSLINNQEFLAVVTTRKKTQDFVNSKLPNNPIGKIKELIKKVLEMLGIENTASAEIVDLMFKVSDIQAKVFNGKPKSKNTYKSKKDSGQTSLDFLEEVEMINEERKRLKVKRKDLNVLRREREILLKENANATDVKVSLAKITRLEKDIEKSELFISDLERDPKWLSIYNKYLTDKEFVENILASRHSMDTNDLNELTEIIELWKSISNRGTNLLELDVEWSNEDIRKELNDIEDTMLVFDRELVKLRDDLTVNMYGKNAGQVANRNTILKGSKDDSSWTSNWRSLSRSIQPILQLINRLIEKTNNLALAAFKTVENKIDSSYDKVKDTLGSDFSPLMQTDENGKKTGALVDRFTFEYWRDYKLFRGLKNSVGKAWLNENTLVLDFASLFDEESNYIPKEYLANKETDSFKSDFVAHVKNLIGENGFNEYMELLNELKLEYYQKRDTQYEILLGTDDKLSPQAYKIFRKWQETHSPFIQSRHAYTGKVKSDVDGKFLKQNSRFDIRIPKSDKYYDSRFVSIEENSDMYNFYNEAKEIIKDARVNYDYKVNLTQNSLPYLDETLMKQIYSGKFSMKENAKAMNDLRIRALTGTDQDVYEEKALKKETQGLEINKNIITVDDVAKDKHEYKLLEYRQRTGNEADIYVSEQLMRDSIIEASENQDLDLVKLLKVLSLNSIAYKHKSLVKDDIEHLTAQFNEGYTNPETGETLQNSLSFLNNTLKSDFYGAPTRIVRGDLSSTIGSKGMLTSENKKKVRILENEIDKVQTDSSLDDDQKISRINDLQTKISGLYDKTYASEIVRGFLSYSRILGIGWNVISSTTNFLFGQIGNLQRGLQGDFFTLKEIKDATNIMIKDFEKVNNISDKVGLVGDVTYSFKDVGADKKGTGALKLTKFLNPYFLQTFSEEFNQKPIMVALMKNTQVFDEEGNESSLYDIMDERGDVDTNWKDVEGLSGDKLVAEVMLNVRKVVAETHGDYTSSLKANNEEWKQALLMFRRWLPEMYMRRFGNKGIDYMNGSSTEGTYRVVLRNIGPVIANKNLSSLTDDEIGKVKSAVIGDMALGIMFFLVGKMLKALICEDDPKCKDSHWAGVATINIMKRLNSEITFFMNPIGNGLEMIDNPISGTRTLSDLISFIYSMPTLWNGDLDSSYYRSGRNKDWNIGKRKLLSITPFGNQVVRTINYGNEGTYIKEFGNRWFMKE